jgi:hypothetical protein
MVKQKQRKHNTPSAWEKEDSGQVRHPHRQVKIIGEKKTGQETIDQEEVEVTSPRNKKNKPV